MVEAAGIDASGGWPKLQFSYAKAANSCEKGAGHTGEFSSLRKNNVAGVVSFKVCESAGVKLKFTTAYSLGNSMTSVVALFHYHPKNLMSHCRRAI